MVTFTQARDALRDRLERVFTGDVFGHLYPGCQIPKVYQGFPVDEPPFYVAVDEIADTAQSNGSASMGHARIDFTVRVWCCARHVSQKTAADTLMAYVDAVFCSVLADQRLDMTVDNGFPQIESAGTAADGSKRYIAAASIAITCQVYSVCPTEIMEVANGSY